MSRLVAQDARLAIPSDALLHKARRQVKALFRDEFLAALEPGEQEALSQFLLDKALLTKDDPPGQMALLLEAKVLAAACGAFDLGIMIVDLIDQRFYVNVIRQKVELLVSIAKNNGPETSVLRPSIIGMLHLLAQDAAYRSDFETSELALKESLTLARRVRQRDLVKVTNQLKDDVRRSRQSHINTQLFQARLLKDAIDPEANYEVGAHFCFAIGDWDKGIAMLALGNDQSLRALAIAELRRASTPKNQLDIGERWIAAAKNRPALSRPRMLGRGVYWLEKARKKMEGLNRVKADRLIARALERGAVRVRQPNTSAKLSLVKLTQPLVDGNLGEARRLVGHDERIQSIVFSPSGRLVASASEDRTVRIWGVDDGKQRHVLAGNVGMRTVTFSKDGNRVLAGDANGVVSIWEVRSGQMIQTLPTLPKNKSPIRQLGINATRRQLVAGNELGQIFIWNVQTGQALNRFQVNGVVVFRFDPACRRLIAGRRDRVVEVWDIESGESLTTFSGHIRSISNVAGTRDGRLVYSATNNGEVRVWDIKSAKQVRSLRTSPSFPVTLAISPSGQYVATNGTPRAQKFPIVVQDTKTGAEIKTFAGHTKAVRSLAFAPDSEFLASAGDDRTISIWKISD